MDRLNQDFLFLDNAEFFVVDFENTGGSLAKGHKITQVGVCVVGRNGNNKFSIIEEFGSLINPERSIPPFIVQKIGITDQMVKDSPKMQYIFTNKLLPLFKINRIFVSHTGSA